MNRNLGVSFFALALLAIGGLSGCSSRKEPVPAPKPLFALKDDYPENAFFSPDGKMVFTTHGDECLYWITESSVELKNSLGTLSDCDTIDFSDDSRLLLTSRLHIKKLWRNDGKTVHAIDLGLPESCKTGAEFSPDFKSLACTSWNKNGTVASQLLFRIGSDLKLELIASLPGAVHAKFSPDSRYLVTSYGNALRIWKNEPAKKPKALAALDLKLDCSCLLEDFSFTGDSKSLVAISRKYSLEGLMPTNKLHLIKMETIEKPVVIEIDLPSEGISLYDIEPRDNLSPGVFLSPNGKTLAIKDRSLNLFLVPIEDARISEPIALGVEQAVFSPDGQALAVRSGHNLKLFKNKPDKDLRPYVTFLLKTRHSNMIFSPNSHYVAVADDIFDRVQIWRNEPSSHPVPKATFEGRGVLAFSPDSGTLLINGALDPREPLPRHVEAWPVPTEGSTK